MKRKTKEDFHNYILDIFDQYKDRLFLGAFIVEVEQDNKKDQYFACKCCYPYLNATIYYNDEALNDFIQTKKDMKIYIVHEFCHLITDPLYVKATNRYVSNNEIEDERERLTDTICNIILNQE